MLLFAGDRESDFGAKVTPTIATDNDDYRGTSKIEADPALPTAQAEARGYG
jgi:hypothetical protein